MTTIDAPSLRDWVSPGRVRAEIDARDAEGVLGELARLISGEMGARRSAEVHALLRDRERMGSTGIGNGCAVPHVRIADLDEAILAVARCSIGIEFGSPDGNPVRLFFGLAVPASSPRVHLRILAAVARWLREPARREALLAAADETAMFAVLADS